MRAERRHRYGILHWLMLVGFLLSLVVQPVLASMGELHELAHGLTETHLHAAGGDDLSDELAAQEEDEDAAAQALHVVHHMAHCCGQGAVAAPALRFELMSPEADAPESMLYARPLTAPRVAPFRPPITA